MFSEDNPLATLSICATAIVIALIIGNTVGVSSSNKRLVQVAQACSKEPANPICESLSQPDIKRWLAQECYRSGGKVEWDTNSDSFKRCN